MRLTQHQFSSWGIYLWSLTGQRLRSQTKRIQKHEEFWQSHGAGGTTLRSEDLPRGSLPGNAMGSKLAHLDGERLGMKANKRETETYKECNTTSSQLYPWWCEMIGPLLPAIEKGEFSPESKSTVQSLHKLTSIMSNIQSKLPGKSKSSYQREKKETVNKRPTSDSVTRVMRLKLKLWLKCSIKEMRCSRIWPNNWNV